MQFQYWSGPLCLTNVRTDHLTLSRMAKRTTKKITTLRE